MNQLAAVSGELDHCTGEVRVTRDIHVGHGETVQVDGRSDHPLNCKRVNVILEPLNSSEGTLIVRTYALIKGNSRRVPLVFRNLSGRKMTIRKGTKMAGDVRAHLNACERCFRFKHPMEKAPLNPLWVTYPFELIHFDFLQIGSTRTILIITDHFTRFAAAFVTQSGSAKAVAKVLCLQYFPFYTWPDKILTDQGRCFESQLFKEILELSKIRKVRTTPYYPATNGQCERFNKTLIHMIGTMPSEVKCSWEDWVATLCHAYNCTVSGVTGYSPFYLMFGRLPKLPIDIEYNVAVEKEASTYTAYVRDLTKRLREAHERAQELIEKESNRQKGYYDRNVRCATLREGDIVLLKEC